MTLGHSDREGTESDSEQTAHFSSLDPSTATAATNTVSVFIRFTPEGKTEIIHVIKMALYSKYLRVSVFEGHSISGV